MASFDDALKKLATPLEELAGVTDKGETKWCSDVKTIDALTAAAGAKLPQEIAEYRVKVPEFKKVYGGDWLLIYLSTNHVFRSMRGPYPLATFVAGRIR